MAGETGSDGAERRRGMLLVGRGVGRAPEKRFVDVFVRSPDDLRDGGCSPLILVCSWVVVVGQGIWIEVEGCHVDVLFVGEQEI